MAEYLFKIGSSNIPKNKLDTEIIEICQSFDAFLLTELEIFLESVENTVKKSNIKHSRCKPLDYRAVQFGTDYSIHIGRVDERVLTANVYQLKGALP